MENQWKLEQKIAAGAPLQEPLTSVTGLVALFSVYADCDGSKDL